ncbi:hypothetical protein PF004_g32995 [Phytophthora fragariae]|nr:hypothetical protein PF004_g32995 [Phytophthora fragariae]
MMMLAVLATAAAKPEVAAAFSELILLLDFREAYDTVARDFLFLTLIKFGFSPEFVAMIQRIHVGTTARFQSQWRTLRPTTSQIWDPSRMPSGTFTVLISSRSISTSDTTRPRPSWDYCAGECGEKTQILSFRG